MVLRLDTQQLQQIKHHAEQVYDHECCGLLIGKISQKNGIHHKVVHQIQSTQNSWMPQPQDSNSPPLTTQRRYWVSPEQFLATQTNARALGCDIIGIYHSHPNHSAVPSECDRQWAWPQYSYIIVSVQQGVAHEVQSWMLDDQHLFQREPLDIL